MSETETRTIRVSFGFWKGVRNLVLAYLAFVIVGGVLFALTL